MTTGVAGYMYPNEITLYWSVLIVLYPYITGLVAGAFILASLERVFRVDAVKPTYRLALLTALAFLLVAPLPLQLHLGHPERSYEMYFTPHRTSAMAMFGFVYLWYLMAVLTVEIWLDYRHDIVVMAQSSTGMKRWIYQVLTLGSSNISERALAIDERVGWLITLIGIPSAFLLHGYVGFIFGSHQSQSLVVVTIDAGGIYFLRHGVGDCCGDAAVHADHASSPTEDRHALRGYDRPISVLHVHPRFQSRNARPDSSYLRGGRVLSQLEFHGPHQALLFSDRSSDLHRDTDSNPAVGFDPGAEASWK